MNTRKQYRVARPLLIAALCLVAAETAPAQTADSASRYRVVVGYEQGYADAMTSASGRYLVRSAIGTASITSTGRLMTADSSIRMEIGALPSRMIPTLSYAPTIVAASMIRDTVGGVDRVCGICLGDSIHISLGGIDTNARAAADTGFPGAAVVVLHGDDTVQLVDPSRFWDSSTTASLARSFSRRVFRDDTLRIHAVHGNYMSRIDTLVLVGRRLDARLAFGSIELNPKDLVAAAKAGIALELTVDSSFALCSPDTLVVRFNNNRTLFRPSAIVDSSGRDIGTVTLVDGSNPRYHTWEATLHVDPAFFADPGDPQDVAFIQGHVLLGDDSTTAVHAMATQEFPTSIGAAVGAKPADSTWLMRWYRASAPYYYAQATGADDGLVRLSELCGRRLLTYPADYFARIVSTTPMPAASTAVVVVETDGTSDPVLALHDRIGVPIWRSTPGTCVITAGGSSRCPDSIPVSGLPSGTYQLRIEGAAGPGRSLVIVH